MLQVARLAPRLLGESAELVTAFLRGQQGAAGGFVDRAGAADLYYTVFGTESLLALRADVPWAVLGRYLAAFTDAAAIGALDLVHASCLARCLGATPAEHRPPVPRDLVLDRVEAFRSRDGAYNATPGSPHGTVYGCFLALGAYQDSATAPPDPQAMIDCVSRLRADDGGYSNQDDMPLGLTPATAAAVTLFRALGADPPAGVADWLLSRHNPAGGFYAIPAAPMPDLLSTATALHALSILHADIAPLREPCLDFIDSLWTNTGSFYGNWTEDTLDTEYTYYGLLALGHLAT